MPLNQAQIDYINACIHRNILTKDTKIFEVFYFGSTKESSEKLYELVKSNKKTATTSALAAFENGVLPKVGDISLVISYEGEPLALIQTLDVQVLPFNQLSYEQIKDEGEDESLSSWRMHHKDFFEREGQRLNYRFSDEMLVVFEHFKRIDPQ